METNTPARKPPIDRDTGRRIADLYCFWRLCGQPTCRRARACRGAPERCLKRLMPLVPKEARDWLVELMQGRELGETFDEAWAAVPPELHETFNAWRAAVLGTSRQGYAAPATERENQQ
jgi:hypothetical protein